MFAEIANPLNLLENQLAGTNRDGSSNVYMNRFLSRIANLRERVSWLSTVTGGPWSAFAFSLAASRRPEHLGRGRYHGTSVAFRGVDIMAIKEVLVDREYADVLPRLGGTSAPVVLDIGAHIGLFSLWVLGQFPKSRIRSVEADPQTYSILRSNVAAARACGAQWDAVNAAAWGADGQDLRFSASGPSMSHRVSGGGEVSVRSVTLKTLMDDWLGENAAVDLMKIDVEGSEEAFICASPELLRRVRTIVVELHPNLCDVERTLDVLRNAYQTVTEVKHRTSSKPLLICY